MKFDLVGDKDGEIQVWDEKRSRGSYWMTRATLKKIFKDSDYPEFTFRDYSDKYNKLHLPKEFLS